MKWLAQTFLQREPIYSTVCLMTRLPLKKMEVCQAALCRRMRDTLRYTEPFPRGDPGNVFLPCVKKYRTPITSDKQSKQRTGISLPTEKKRKRKKKNSEDKNGREGRERKRRKNTPEKKMEANRFHGSPEIIICFSISYCTRAGSFAGIGKAMIMMFGFFCAEQIFLNKSSKCFHVLSPICLRMHACLQYTFGKLWVNLL